MSKRTSMLALGAVLTALALGLSYFERMIPLGLLIPLPGIKLGLANVVTGLCLYALGTRTAFLVLILRCLMGTAFTGITALAFSLTGGLLAMVVMAAAVRTRVFSVIGVCILGAAAHNTGQVLAAMAMMKSQTLIVYLAPLLLVSVVTGLVTGMALAATLRALERNGQLARMQERK